MESVAKTYGYWVFNDRTMRETLPNDVYQTLKATIREGKDIDLDIANVVANAMKDWAVAHGATHYTHWFQPMTGSTAEKHESFLTPLKDGTAIMEFRGKELIKGEPDASSLPSGGLRATFEARGYTAWDPTSFAFIKERTLCIPTAYCSYSGEALDEKTPLLHSMEAINEACLKILKLFGKTNIKRVYPTVGLEQEYFLIDKELYNKRPDLKFCGRTLLGAPSPKGQELDDHYSGAFRPRVAAFMKELDEELWKFGICAKTEHNEAAPSQHELAPLFSVQNLGVDQNQLIMEEMKKIADKQGLACLLHEKPFAGLNGSGKHNNWSLQTDTGLNLLEPTDSPSDNAQFLLFFCAFIKAVDEHQGLLRFTVANAGNDNRLGGNEAPPAIISMFIGDDLQNVLESIESGSKAKDTSDKTMVLNVHVLPNIPKDSTDRNRTSPMAFTGNKFEFRMPGSSINTSSCNVVLNIAVADALNEFTQRLQEAKDFDSELENIIRDTYSKHKRIIFNGNNYDESWKIEAQKRGLCNYVSTVDAVSEILSEKSIKLFKKYGIFTEAELESRYDIYLENYSKIINIEAKTLLDMVQRSIIPAANKYLKKLCDEVIALRSVIEGITTTSQLKTIKQMQDLLNSLSLNVEALLNDTETAQKQEDLLHRAKYCHTYVLSDMEKLRKDCDELEPLCCKEDWPLPTYQDLLFSV